MIPFWCKYNTINCFLDSQGKLICFRKVNILHMVFLELLLRVLVEFVFFQFRIIDVVFLILIITFLEKFCILCNLISYLGVCHNELRQISVVH